MPIGLGDEKLWLCPSLENSPNDLSGNNNNGVYQNGMGTVADTAEGGSLAYDFDGVGDYINCGDVCNFTSQISISSWVKSDSLAVKNTIVQKRFTNNIESYNFRLETDGELNFYTYSSVDGDSGVFNLTAGDVTTGSWYHVVGSFDGAKWQTFVNGIKISESIDSQGPYSNASELSIGASRQNANTLQYFNGLVDDVRIYNRVLTQSEITHLATARGIEGRPFDGLGGEQLWLCPSLENSPNDLSGNNNNGVYNGGMGTATDVAEGGSLAYDFDGTDDFISLGDITSSSQAEFCVSAWVKRSNSDSNVIMAKRDNTDYQWDMSKSGTNIVYFGPSDNANRANSGSTALSLNQWDHVACQVSATQVEVYVNGTLEGTHAYTGGVTDTSASMTVGRRGMSFPNEGYFTGYMDDIRAYNRALTLSEISWLATERGVLGTPPEGLGDEQLWLCPSIDDSPDDLSGNGNNGTYSGGMGTVTSDGKLAYDFDGVDDYIDCGDILDCTSGGNDTAVTYTSWMKIDNYTNSNNLYGTAWMGKCDNVSNGGYILSSINGQITLDRFPAGSNGSISLLTRSPASQVPLTTWKHVAVTYSGCETTGCTSIYIDGVAVSVTETSSSYGTGMGENADTFKIGETLSGLPYKRMMDGQLDDIRVYDRVLTQAEISWLATERGVLGTPPEGLGDEQLWLCPSIQDSANDLSGNGNDGTYQGGAGTISDVAEGGTRSYEFTNSSHYITGTTDLDTTDDFSLSYWYRSNTGNSFGTNYHMFRARNGTRGFNFYKRYSSGTQTYTGTTICRGGASSNSNTPVDYGIATADWLDWHCFTMNWDNASSTMEYFIDGVSVGTWNASVSGSVDATGTTMILGALGNGTGTANGYIDDIRKYSRKLTQSEITHLATSRGVLGSPTATTQYNAFFTHAFRQLFQTRLR